MDNEIDIPSPPPPSSSSRRGRVVAHIKQKLLVADTTATATGIAESAATKTSPGGDFNAITATAAPSAATTTTTTRRRAATQITTSLFSSSSSSSPSSTSASESSIRDVADSPSSPPSRNDILATKQQQVQQQDQYSDAETPSSSSSCSFSSSYFHHSNENNPSVLNTTTTTTIDMATTSNYSFTADMEKAKNLSSRRQQQSSKSRENVDTSNDDDTTTTTTTNVATFRNGTVCRLFIDKYTEDEFWDILDALNSNHVVQKIVIFRSKDIPVDDKDEEDDGDDNNGGDYYNDDNDENQNNIVSGSNKSSSKTKLPRRRRSSDDVDYLFHVLRSLQTLTELNIWNLTNDDLASLSLGLVDHPSIVYLQLHFLTGTLDETVGKAIATTMRKLVSVEVEVSKSFPLWPFATSQSLSVLSVVSNRFKWESRHILPFVDRLERNGGSALTVLDLEPEMSCECLCEMISSIRSSSSSSFLSTNRDEGHVCPLETLQFNCQTQNKAEGDELCDELSKLIESNEHRLRVVWNHRYESLAVHYEKSESTIVKSIECSSFIEQFHVFVESRDFSSQKENLLKANIDRRKLEWMDE